MIRRQAISLLLGGLPLRRFLQPSEGCIILLDIRTQKILASNDSALSGKLLAPPGSTLKPFTLAALLAQNKLPADYSFACPERLTLAGRRMDCSHPRMAAPMRIDTAIAYSCNCFVAHVAERFGSGELAHALRQYGLDATPETGERQQLQALGETGIMITPEGLAQAYRQLAIRPAAPILAGLEGCVDFGTGQLARVAWATLAGKTGSTRLGAQPVAWFAGFVPSRNPEATIVVMLAGKHGSSDAAPVAAQALDAWHGGVQLKVKSSADGRVISIPLEKYVAAVLAGESAVFQSNEALKAMAVAARTYAIQMRGRHASEGFDLCDTTHCQRMVPSSVTPRLEAAAADTAGQFLWYAGKPAETLYTRDCGGQTEDGSSPWLKSHPDPWCAHARWNWSADPDRIVQALRHESLAAPDRLSRISILERTPSGRAATLLLSGNRDIRISASSFRFAIGREFGWNTLPSDKYEVRMSNGRPFFEGSGSGNGTGLCQIGAEAMGRAGKSWREILAFYYPGTVAGLNAQGLPWQRLSGERITLLTVSPNSDRAVLSTAERIAGSLASRTAWPLPRDIEIRVYPDLDTFRNATAEPGWVAAHTAGHRIDLQPVATLRERGVLESTISHELIHVAMESQAAPGVPLWFREGLADFLENPHITGRPRIPAEADLRQTGDPTRARRAYADAAAMVASLVRRYGETAVLGWVSRGLPADVMKASASQAIPNNK